MSTNAARSQSRHAQSCGSEKDNSQLMPATGPIVTTPVFRSVRVLDDVGVITNHVGTHQGVVSHPKLRSRGHLQRDRVRQARLLGVKLCKKPTDVQRQEDQRPYSANRPVRIEYLVVRCPAFRRRRRVWFAPGRHRRVFDAGISDAPKRSLCVQTRAREVGGRIRRSPCKRACNNMKWLTRTVSLHSRSFHACSKRRAQSLMRDQTNSRTVVVSPTDDRRRSCSRDSNSNSRSVWWISNAINSAPVKSNKNIL